MLTKVTVVRTVHYDTSVCGQYGGGVAAYVVSILVSVCCTDGVTVTPKRVGAVLM